MQAAEYRASLNDYHNTLIFRLKLIENLWRKRVQSAWFPESLELLAGLIAETASTATIAGDKPLSDCLAAVQRQLAVCRERLSDETERERLTGQLDELKRLQTGLAQEQAGALDELSASMAEIIVVGSEDTRKLLGPLNDAGFRAHYFAGLAEAEAILELSAPIALFIDIDFPGQPLAGVTMVARLQTHKDLTAPVFFIADRDDILKRMDVARVSGAAYLVRPVSAPVLLERLNYRLFDASPVGYNRVLIVEDNPSEAERMSETLEAEGILTEILTEPLFVLEALQRFKPDLVVVDLALADVDGLEVARVVRQHREYQQRPVLLLSDPMDVGRQLGRLHDEGDDLLAKPVASDHLYWIVKQRLRRLWSSRAKMAALSRRDAISSLYYRRYFLAQLEHNVAELDTTNGRSVAVMLIVLDNLRAVREATDTVTVDELVGRAGERLKLALKSDSQSSSWFGEDVFAVLIGDADRDKLLDLAGNVHRALDTQVYKVGGHEIRLRTCIGIAFTEEGEEDFMGLVRQADLACDLAREKHGEHIHLYNSRSDSDAEAFYGQQLMKDIRDAVEEGNMSLVFQPIVSLKGDATERYEVLLRMRSHSGRELLPGIVFGAVQKHPLSSALDRWVIAQTVHLLLERRNRPTPTIFFVNISSATLRDDSLQTWLREHLENIPEVTQHLVFEVTTATANQYPQELESFMSLVKPWGCRISLERFGLGEDAVDAIEHLHFDYIKLDHSFMEGLAQSQPRQNRLKAVVDSVSHLKGTVVATGVEDLRALPILWSCGVNFVQGYFLQQPHEKMSFDFQGLVL